MKTQDSTPKTQDSINDRPPNFRHGGKFYLMRCFACVPFGGRENWGMCVAAGKCAWCGWDRRLKRIRNG